MFMVKEKQKDRGISSISSNHIWMKTKENKAKQQ